MLRSRLECLFSMTLLHGYVKQDDIQELHAAAPGELLAGDRRARQGLTLVHFSAQLKRFLWNKGCFQGLFTGCSSGVRGHEGVCRVYFVSETAQVELKSGRV